MLLKINHKTFDNIHHLFYLKIGKTEIISFYLYKAEDTTYSRLQLFNKLVMSVNLGDLK